MATSAPKVLAPDRADRARPGVWLTDILLLLMAIIWGVNFSVIKYGTRLVEPLAYNATRIALAAVTLLAITRLMRLPTLQKGDIRRLVMLGVLGNGVYQYLFIEGVSRSRVATTALVLASTPAMIAILGRLRGSEHLSRRSWIGIALQLVGVAAVVLATAAGVAGEDSVLGSVLVLAAGFSWALFAVLLKPLSQRVSTVQMGAYTLVGGAIVSVLVAVPALARVPWPTLPIGAWGAVLYSGLGALVLANLFWYRGLKVLGPTRTALYSNLQPLIAMIVAWMALGELPTPWQLVGAVCITAGLLLART